MRLTTLRARRIAALVVALATMPAIAFALVRTFADDEAPRGVDPAEVLSVEGGSGEEVILPADLERLLVTVDLDNPFVRRVESEPLFASPPSSPEELDLRWPVGGRARITSPFGPRGAGFHHGLDIGCPLGAPIRAADAGVVVWTGSTGVYGAMVVMHHGGGNVTMYAHLSEIAVGEGQRLIPGQVLGACGSTGLSTGPHLHFELRWDGRAWDPARFLP